MPRSQSGGEIPEGYAQLEGSERRPSPTARVVGPVDPNERISVTIVVRRRPDGEPMPDFEHFRTTRPHIRPRVSQQEFAAKYGASDDDLKKVTDFARGAGLAVEETHAARRTVVVSGSAEQMSEAFGVTLQRYEHQVERRRGEQPVTETYRGRDGFIHIPQDLAGIIVGVFGLDNRRITKRNSDPPNTVTVSVSQVTQLYNFPTNSAAGQTIAIFSETGYQSADISTNFGGSPPTITDISVDANNDGSADLETTQDITIAGLAAPGSAIAVYFTTYDEKGWVDLINRVIHPNQGDPVCSVLSSSFYVLNGDDAAVSAGASQNWVNAVTAAFQDAAVQSVTVCIASGDSGTQSKIFDGKAHVQYPGSDPWVLSVGGTTIGNINGSSFDEYVWNDDQGATGGGVSDYFPLPSYQNGVGVPKSLNDNHVGRGVPDVAANASANSGYPLTVGGVGAIGNGTSAAAPLWAGLIAVLNAALGENVGFVNPAIYEIGSAGFYDIVSNPGATDNSFGGVAGYPVGPGWDACTGWGSPNGQALLNTLKSIYTRQLYFVVDKSTYGRDEVNDVINTGGGKYVDAFWLVLEGFSKNQLGGLIPTLSGPFNSISGITIAPDGAGPQFQDASNEYAPQRIRFGYNITFTSQGLSVFPTTGNPPVEELLNASIKVAGTTVSAETDFELAAGADPYFTNIDPLNNNVFYLSQDIRVFSAANSDTPLAGGPTMTGGDAYGFMQKMIGFLNSTPSFTTPSSSDPLNALPGQTGYETGDSSVTPLNGVNQQNYNFAIARVRLQDVTQAKAPNVRVFFRLWVAQSFDTDFQPSTTYLSTLGTSGDDLGKPVFPLPSGTGLMDPQGNSIQTIPFFATDANGTHDYDGTVTNANIRDIQIPTSADKVWAYYGCFLDVYDASNQSKFPGTHHCIVAQIAYDDAPIINANGVTESPENSDKLAQRNLQITSSGNPSYPLTHRVPQAFDMRPSPTLATTPGELLDYPDELMIDWGNTPVGSIGNIYWPQIDSADILALAAKVYGTSHSLVASDANTIRCSVPKGITYIPIPSATGKNFAGLITLELPSTVRVGQEYRVKVRRVATRRFDATIAQGPQTAVEAGVRKRGTLNWRYVTGTFQITIPVGSDQELLLPEETTLAVLKWRRDHMSPVYRWYPVMQRYIEYVSGRVLGFGGDPNQIEPSLTPIFKQAPKPKFVEYQGKVREVVFDCFGDPKGFVLRQCCGEERFFEARERSLSELVLRACREGLRVSVCAAPHHRESVCEIRVGC
jgi:hypothetical protein